MRKQLSIFIVFFALLPACRAVWIDYPDAVGPAPSKLAALEGLRIGVPLPSWSTELAPGPRDGGAWYVLPASPERRRAIQAAVVEALNRGPGGEAADSRALALAEAADDAGDDEQAREQGCDLRLALTVTEYRVGPGKQFWPLWAPVEVLYFWTFFPQQLVPDEKHEVRLALDLGLRDPHLALDLAWPGAAEPGASFRLEARTRGYLSELAKGWNLVGWLAGIPASLPEASWERVSSQLEPALLAWCGHEAAGRLAPALDSAAKDHDYAVYRAVLAGVSNYERLPMVASAQAQMQLLDEVLRQRHGLLEFNRGNLTGQVTAAVFGEALDRMVRLSRERDTLLVAFAGRGVIAPAGGRPAAPCLLFSDADCAAGTGLLTLDELYARLARASGRVVLVLDTDFQDHVLPPARGADCAGALAPQAALSAGWPPPPPNAAVLFACEPGQQAWEGHLLEGIAEGHKPNPNRENTPRWADVEPDGRVSLAELERYLKTFFQVRGVWGRQAARQNAVLLRPEGANPADEEPDWLRPKE